MPKPHQHALLGVLVVLATLWMFSPPAGANDEPLLVIVGLNFPASDISFSTLKEAFKGRIATVRGARLIPINHPQSSAQRVTFDRLVLGLSPAAVGRFWVDARVRDEGQPPTTPATSELTIRVVASLPNAISYATHAQLSPKVKVLTVDGKSADDADYALKP